MSSRRVYYSTSHLEWWNAHLSTALSRDLEVVPCPMARPGRAGHPAETDISRLIDAGGGHEAIYMGSLDQIFRGIPDLPMPTGIWTDYLGAINSNFLPILRLFDVVFCSQKDSVDQIRCAGNPHVEWLPFAFDTTLRSDPHAERIYDVGFVGSLGLQATKAERLELLGRLERRHRLNDYHRPVFGDDLVRVYNQSRIVVNFPAHGGLNMRVFEALASGALLITKRVANGQNDLFREGMHLVTYENADDLMDKVGYFLKNDREREEIAQNGMAEVLGKHTYFHRAKRVAEVMTGARRGRAEDIESIAAGYLSFYNHLGRTDLLGMLAFHHGVGTRLRARALARAVWKFWRNAQETRRQHSKLGI